MSDNEEQVDYRFEQTRLESYARGGWTSEHVRPADLAAAGFYWTGTIDRVRCFESRMMICRWEDGDDPMTEHQRWFGRCRFIRNLACGNVPIGMDVHDIPTPPPRSRDVTGLYRLEYRLDAEADRHGASSSASSSTSQPPVDVELPSASPASPQPAAGNQLRCCCGDFSCPVLQLARQLETMLTGFGERIDNMSREMERRGDILTCKIWMQNAIELVFLPCGHVVSCTECASAMNNCPLCRRDVSDPRRRKRIYFA